MIVIKGYLAYAAGKGHGQLAGRVNIPQQYVGNSQSSFLAGEPGLQDSGHVGGDPVDGQGAAVGKYYGYGFAGGLKRSRQLHLLYAKVQACSILSFSYYAVLFTQDYDGGLCLICSVEGLVQEAGCGRIRGRCFPVKIGAFRIWNVTWLVADGNCGARSLP